MKWKLVEIHHDFSKVSLDQLEVIYKSVGWEKHTQAIIQQVFEASNIYAFATVKGEVVGFGRAITDHVFNAAIYDVVVHPDFQRNGIAKRIMESLLGQLKHVSCVHLISTMGNEGFYQKLGFKKMKTGMARYLNSNLVDEYLE